MSHEGVFVDSDGYRDLELRGKTLNKHVELVRTLLIVKLEGLLNFVVQVLSEAVLVLKAVQVNHFFSNGCIAFVRGLED